MNKINMYKRLLKEKETSTVNKKVGSNKFSKSL
jgi:hypothetical protein